jgi:superfamily II DNA/RNA helicase
MIIQLSDRFQKHLDSTKLEQKNTLERGKTFLELITRISTKDRAIAQSFVSQFDLFDYNDYKTAQDGIRRHQYRHAVKYLQENGETWQFIIESEKDTRGYAYLAPDKNGNRAFFPAVPADIRNLIGNHYKVDVPLDGSFWDWLQQNKHIPIIITEGGGKALAGLSHGFVTIALYGCSCLSSPDLLPYLNGRDVYIAFDMDTKPSAVKAVQNALSKHLKPLSKLAKLTKVVTWDKAHKGIDDLLTKRGVTALEKAIKSALSGKKYLDNKHENTAAARLEANKIKADLTLDRLPTYAELQEIYKTHRDVFLSGAKGLGKSELGGQFVKNADSALLPVPLESLARNNAERFGIDYRTDCDRVNGQLIGGAGFVSKLSFCTEAIHGLKSHINSGLERGAAVFNDELDLQLNSLAISITHAQNGKRKVNESLYWEMQTRAKQTLSVSADLTQYEAELFERKTGRKPFIIRVETPKKNYEVRLFEDNRGIILHKIPQAIRAGERLMICCSRKSEAKFLAWLFRDYGAIAIHRDNANEPMFKGFFDNPNQWLSENKPRILIVSPVLRSGFSITGDFFDKVFCLFHSDSINASTALQLSERYRPQVPRYIFAANSSGKYRHITPESILKTRIGRAKAAGSNEISFVDEHDSYYHYKSADNWSKANFRADIIARLKDETNCDDLKVEPNKLDRADAAIYAAEIENFKTYEQEKLRDSRNLSKAEYESMKDRRDLLEADLLAVEKFRLSNWSDTAPESVTIEQIDRDDKGKKRKALERLEKQAYPELAVKQDKHSLEAQQAWGYGIAHQDVTHTALTQKALEQIGLHDFLDFVLSGNSWHIVEEDGAINGTTEAIAFAQKLRDLRNSKIPHIDKKGKEYFTHIDKLAELGIHLSCGLNSGLASYIGAMLSWLGLARSAKRETINKKRVRVYQLHEADLAITRAELSRRAARLMGEGELLASHPFVERLSSLSTPFLSTPIKRCGQVAESPKTQTDGGGFGAKVIKKVETFVNDLVQTIENYCTPEEMAAGYF